MRHELSYRLRRVAAATLLAVRARAGKPAQRLLDALGARRGFHGLFENAAVTGASGANLVVFAQRPFEIPLQLFLRAKRIACEAVSRIRLRRRLMLLLRAAVGAPGRLVLHAKSVLVRVRIMPPGSRTANDAMPQTVRRDDRTPR